MVNLGVEECVIAFCKRAFPKDLKDTCYLLYFQQKKLLTTDVMYAHCDSYGSIFFKPIR